jgi:uncharacterized protein (DUF427 family)
MMASITHGRVRVEDGPKRVRVLFGGRFIADTTQVKLVWEKPYYPTYYIPAADVLTDVLAASGAVDHSPSRGDAAVHDVKVDDRTAPAAALWYASSKIPALEGMIRFDWDAMDAWFEEDEQVYVHPRDPYSRVDILASSRHVRVEVDGVTVADSHHPRLLFETGLPTRYYVPKTDVRIDLLAPTDHTTRCPYKGTAEYYSLTINGTTHDNAVWWYRYPTLESAQIAGYVCFYNEHVDLYVDGVLQERPKSPFS